MDINNFNTQQHLDNSIIQMMAECYWEDYFLTIQSQLDTNTYDQNKLFALQLQYGNTTFRFKYINGLPIDEPTQEQLNSLTNTTKTSNILADYAATNFEIIDYKPNDITGLSCILVKNKNTSEYTLAFRSTEYSSNLDPSSTDVSADKEINSIGYAVGQIASMEHYYQTVLKDKLPINATLNISGYSLGGHLANAFYLMHKDEISNMNLFNAPGVGVIGMPAINYAPNLSCYDFGTNIKNMADEVYNSYSNFTNTFLYKEDLIDGVLIKTNFSSLDVKNNIGNIAIVSGQNNSNSPDYYFISTAIDSNISNEFAATLNQHYGSFSPNQKILLLKALQYDNNGLIYASLGSKLTDTNNIYSNDDVYIFLQSYVKDKYQLSNINIISNGIPTVPEISTLNNTLGDVNNPSSLMFSNNQINNLYGFSDNNLFDNLPSDFSFVAQTQVHSEGSAIFIEDQPEVIKFSGENVYGRFNFNNAILKDSFSLTKSLAGDFGNTHSITLVQDSLEAMSLIKQINGSISLTEGNRILSSVSNSYSPRWVPLVYGNKPTSENNIISKFVGELADILDPNVDKSKFLFPNIVNGFSNLKEKNELHSEINTLKAKISDNSNLHLISLDIYTQNENNNITNMVAKASQNDSEGDAWKYALLKQNGFVLTGNDYSTNKDYQMILDNQNRSESFWKERSSELLDKMLLNKVNSGIYVSNYSIKDNISNIKTVSLNSLEYYKHNENDIYGFNRMNLEQKISPYLSPSNNKNVIFGDSQFVNYSGTLKNDYIFTGNGDNYINLTKYRSLSYNNNIDTIKTFGVFDFTYSQDMYNNDIDYVETGSGNNTITADSNYVNYYLRGTNTLFGDYVKGSLTLNGKKIDGNDFYSHTNFNYEYLLQNNGSFDLKITDLTTENSSLTINNITQIKLGNLGIENVPTYNNLTTPDATSFNLEKTVLNNQSNPFKAYVVEHNGRIDGAMYDPQASYSYNLSLVRVNAAFYKENNDLYVFDEQTTISHKFVDYFNPQTFLTQYNTDNNGNLIPMSVTRFDSTDLADGSFSIFDLSPEFNQNSIINPQEYTPSYSGNTNTSINIRPYDKIILDRDTNVLGYFSRNNDDLIFKLYSNGDLTNYKNYFKINEFSNGNGLYFKDSNGQNTSVSNLEFMQYVGVTGTQGNDTITFNGTFGLAYGGDGNNHLIGDSQDNTFIVNHSINSSTLSHDILDGGDGGNDTYKVGSGTSDVIISNFKQNDKLFVSSLGVFNFSVENNDLIMVDNYRYIKLQNYMLNKTDFGINSGIYLNDDIQPFDFSKLYEHFSTSLFSTDSNQNILDSISKTDVKTIFDNNNNNTIIVRNSNTDVFISSGNDIVEKLGGSMNVNLTTISGGSLYIKNFDSSTDTINLTLSNSIFVEPIETVIQDNNLTISIGGYKVFIENYGSNYDNSFSGINIDNGLLNPITKEELFNLSLGETTNTGVINGSGSRSSVIYSSFTDGKTVKGTNNSDFFNIIGNVTVLTSNGSDTFNLNDQSKILTIKYDTDFVNYFESYNKLNINLDPNTNLADLKLYYNPQNGNASIVTGIDSNNNPKGVLLTNFPVEYMSYLENFISIKLNNSDVPLTGVNFKFGEPLDLNATTIETNTANDLIYLTTDKKLIALSTEVNTILYGTDQNDLLESDKGNNLLFGGLGDDMIVGNYQNKNQNGNLIFGAEGNDNIYAGDNDIINFYQNNGNDTIISTDNSHIKLNIMKMPEDETFALSFSAENNNLMIKYNNLQNDVITLKDFWDKPNNFELYVNSVSSQGTNTKVYELNDILTRLNMSKSTVDTFTVNYSDGLDLIKQTYSNEMLGGEISTYPMLQNSNNLTLVGISIPNAQNILSNLNTTPVSSI